MALSSKVGSVVLNTSTGNQSVTELGFLPKVLLFYITKQTADGSNANANLCYGLAISSSSRVAIALNSDDGVTTENSDVYHTTANCIILISNAGVPVLAADFVSMDADGFTINIGTTDGNAYIVNFTA